MTDNNKKKRAPAEHAAHAVAFDSNSEDGVGDLISDDKSIPDLMSVESSNYKQLDDDDGVDDWFLVTNEDSPCDFTLGASEELQTVKGTKGKKGISGDQQQSSDHSGMVTQSKIRTLSHGPLPPHTGCSTADHRGE